MNKIKRDMEKEKYWRTTIAKWKQSGQPIEAYCRSNGINSGTFHWWKRELFIRDCEVITKRSSRDTDQTCKVPGFAEVKVFQRK
ncbi:MAG: hypothetical protein A2161_03870 [Candidatus Schekmanbacteria bacterium RBG_13_48_7]|uniref:Transposase n=1 Tax=Candidatus Schekmanbacteria bacterium RBG_13_48_7 TaxID=1817878 RepID=A0A1F7RZA6_9BACT|nr:MAG: hypothetical protein A2161_03870 [Candidatus Schekmanbacteria bacterium RBG_13_48_7]